MVRCRGDGEGGRGGDWGKSGGGVSVWRSRGSRVVLRGGGRGDNGGDVERRHSLSLSLRAWLSLLEDELVCWWREERGRREGEVRRCDGNWLGVRRFDRKSTALYSRNAKVNNDYKTLPTRLQSDQRDDRSAPSPAVQSPQPIQSPPSVAAQTSPHSPSPLSLRAPP